MDIIAPLAQRWQRNGQHIKAENQIISELSSRNQFVNILVCSRNYPNINLD